MNGKTTSGLFELYERDPEKADRLVFGRVSNPDRRGFLKGAGLTTMSAMVGGAIPFAANLPSGFIPIALADAHAVEGKDGLTLLNDRPLNAETPAHLPDDAVTPTARHFIRNNGMPPDDMDADTWTLKIDGLVDRPMELSIADLGSRFEVVTEQLTLECGGKRAGVS